MRGQEAQHSVATMSRLLGVLRSGFYSWAGRGASQHAAQGSVLSGGIQRIHEYSRGTYGAPRIHAELAFGGTHVGRKRTTTTVRDRTAVLAPDLVKRDFRARGPNRLWVADITHVPTWAGFLYVAVVLDAWSRRVVGWAFARDLRPARRFSASSRRPKPTDRSPTGTCVSFSTSCRQPRPMTTSCVSRRSLAPAPDRQGGVCRFAYE
jgi:putative transposase